MLCWSCVRVAEALQDCQLSCSVPAPCWLRVPCQAPSLADHAASPPPPAPHRLQMFSGSLACSQLSSSQLLRSLLAHRHPLPPLIACPPRYLVSCSRALAGV